MIESTKCNLCGSDKYSVVYKTYDGDISDTEPAFYAITNNSRDVAIRIVKCTICGLIYANPRPSPDLLVNNYIKSTDSLYLEEEAGRRLSAKKILKELKKIKKAGRILDIGCAAGFLLDEAQKAGFNIHGIELSKWAADYARNKLGIKTICQGMLKEAGYPKSHFDVIVLSDVIEHLIDPKGTLVEIRKLLKPDGVICINTPDINSLVSKILRARWWGVKNAHLYYFTRKTLNKILHRTGFLPIKAKTHSRTFTIKYLVNKLNDYNKALYKICSFLTNNKTKDLLININLGDQIEVYAQKARKLKYLDETEEATSLLTGNKLTITAVLPAYNAAKTLKKTVSDIPRDIVNNIILVDDASSDDTVRIARELGIEVFTHEKNKGYGGNQKTCYKKAIEKGADIVVMVHPDYQYDPKAIPELVKPIIEGKADAVFGSRMMKGGALQGGMPLWKHNANIILTAIENVIFRTYLTEYHSGFRAYSAKALRSIRFDLNSDGFIFDTEIIAQILLHNFKIEEVPIRTRYFDEASSIKLLPSILYGLGILKTLLKYIVHTHTFIKFRQFE
ncbi:MAG: methyltransferase domain-containing protein [Candidatus Omnitrophica bacterium]|nr:methyltransferase domain-containing protein [Candidatus Omnitrophota bacterium]